MRAYKCDRCGKLFERYEGQGTAKFYNITCKPNITGNCLDLCPKCNAELQEWVANVDKEQVDCTSIDADNIKENNPDKWIPVSDHLPDEGKTVMVSTEHAVYPEARYTKECGWEWAYESGADYWVELVDVTAWMPLPTTYKPEESEE